MVLYAATTNPGKLAEFAESASDDGITVLALPNLSSLPEPVEDAPTFRGNAAIKAIAYSLAAPGLLVFADDSGLEVDALNGAPGVRSARFADDRSFDLHSVAAKDDRNNRCLLSLLKGVPGEDRSARFVCALALAQDGQVIHRAEGQVEGEILDAPRGDSGFGYDPLFLIPWMALTMAEQIPLMKWEIGHRGRAFRELLTEIRRTQY
jgi:XTP/dITP diphosphohydrolase